MSATPPPKNRLLALAAGASCHALFALGVGAMVANMYAGMQWGQGVFEGGKAWAVNALLLLQFPLGHSLLLTDRGRRFLTRLAPHGATLATTSYAALASLQLVLLFGFWSPSGIIWWQAEGIARIALTGAYGVSWALLGKSMLDAGLALQSGFLGWSALFRGVAPRFPDMPETGLFRFVRQPIYVSFTLTLWTVPVWTPDQLAVALTLTAYCLTGPLLKERRFARFFGDRFAAYQRRVPYWLPRRF